MERVTIHEGSDENSLLLISPHQDDDFCGQITKQLAENLNAYAVINNGWERDEHYNYDKEKANCNNVEHLHEDVVKEEFLDPIIRYAAKIKSEFGSVEIFLIHGMANPNPKENTSLDCVVGFGDAKVPSYTCSNWRKDGFMYLLANNHFDGYLGKAGGKYSGASRKNLNQYFRIWQPDQQVHSMQIEITKDLREDADMAVYTADQLSPVLKQYSEFVLHVRDFGKAPKDFVASWQDIGKNRPTW